MEYCCAYLTLFYYLVLAVSLSSVHDGKVHLGSALLTLDEPSRHARTLCIGIMKGADKKDKKRTKVLKGRNRQGIHQEKRREYRKGQ